MKYRVLCVEDDEVDRRALKRRFERAQLPFEPEFVESVQAAITSTEERCPDIVLLDWTLQDGSGKLYLDHVSKHVPWLPVVVLTGGSEDLAPETLLTGAQDFLIKDRFDNEQLERTLLYAIWRSNVLHLRQLDTEARSKEPIRRYSIEFIRELRAPVRALAFKLDRLSDAISHGERVEFDPVRLRRAVIEMREQLDSVLSVSRALATKAREGHFLGGQTQEGEPDRILEKVDKEDAASSPFYVGRRLSILIIDNEHYMQLMFTRLLGKEHDLTFASSVPEAADKLAESKAFDGILCNFYKIGNQANELEAILKELAPSLIRHLVFFITGQIEDSFGAFLESSGARALPKPFELEQLRSALLHWVALL